MMKITENQWLSTGIAVRSIKIIKTNLEILIVEKIEMLLNGRV